MNNKPLYVHTAIAVVSVSAAYAVWQRSGPRPVEADQPVVAPLSRNELKELLFIAPQNTLSLQPRKDDAGENYVWVTVSREGHPPVSFRGGRYANHVLDGYLPLHAIRELGTLGAAQLKEGGLEQTNESVRISSASGQRELKVGTATVAGEGRRILDTGNQRVYLLPADLLPKAERAMGEMFDTELHGFPADETTRVAIEFEGKQREASVGGRHDPPIFWSWKDDAEHPSQELTSWMEHVDRLMARMPAVTSNPPGEPKLKVTYFRGNQERGFFKMWGCQSEERKKHCLAATERTIGFVDVGPIGEQIANDAGRILSTTGERIARPGNINH